jgi:hypothetical protein
MNNDRLPRSYDEWRTRNQQDDEDERDYKRKLDDEKADRADEERDRQKDERAERRQANDE